MPHEDGEKLGFGYERFSETEAENVDW